MFLFYDIKILTLSFLYIKTAVKTFQKNKLITKEIEAPTNPYCGINNLFEMKLIITARINIY